MATPAKDPVERRAETLLPEERAAGVDDPEALARVVMEESEQRSNDRNAAPDTIVEHRRSGDTV